MPERPTARQNQPANPDQRRSLKGRRGDKGLYTRLDSDAFLLNTMVPVLARSLGAAEPTLRGMRGMYGSVNFGATRHQKNGDSTYYSVDASRMKMINDAGESRGEVKVEISVAHTHPLDEHELIAEWPLLEQLGVADDLQIAAAQLHVDDFFDPDDVDLDDPMLRIDLAMQQAEAMEELTDDELASEQLFGERVLRYVDRTVELRIGRRPTLRFRAGYETDEESYALEFDHGYGRPQLIGNTPAELEQFMWLKEETSRNAEDEIMREFEDALVAVGILSARVKKRAPSINSTVQRR